MLIVAKIWKLSFRPPGTPRVLVNVKSTGVRFQLHPPRQLSTTLRHFISPPRLSLVRFKISEPEKSCGKKEQDINGFRWTTIHIVKNTKSYVIHCKNISLIGLPQVVITSWGWFLWGRALWGRHHLSGLKITVFKEPGLQTICGIKWPKH